MRAYLLQLRQELGARLLEHVFDANNGKPNKVSFFVRLREFGREMINKIS